MALTISQVTTNTSTAVQVCVVPPGGSVTLQTTGANANYVGLSSTVTSATGFPFLTGANSLPVTWTLPPTSQSVTLYAISVTAGSTLAFAVASTT